MNDSIALGKGDGASGSYGTAVGQAATATYASSVALGRKPTKHPLWMQRLGYRVIRVGCWLLR